MIEMLDVLPFELLYEICAWAIAEYLDSLIVGHLKLPLHSVSEEGGSSLALRREDVRAVDRPLQDDESVSIAYSLSDCAFGELCTHATMI
jgi:hypothetical protein